MTLQRTDIEDMLIVLKNDRDDTLLRLDAYIRGNQPEPYAPDDADDEYRMLAKRSITNVCPFIISTPAQALYVDQFRRGNSLADAAVGGHPPEWDHWERSNLQTRQHAIYRAALGYGHAFTVTEFNKKGDLITRGLSPLRTVGLFDDPANDIVPVVALTVKRWPVVHTDGKVTLGKAIAWDEKYAYQIEFKGLNDPKVFRVTARRKHGANENPVTRFTCHVDLEGRTTGVIEPMLELQDRLNQTVFDMLMVQTGSAFKVRTVTGMAPPVLMEAIYEEGFEGDSNRILGWKPKLDENGRKIPDRQAINARNWMWGESKDVSFGTLPETPLDGFIKAIDLAFRHISALSQTPPHHLLGQIANLSADALLAAETALQRKIEEFKSSFGESWERVFRLVLAMLGEEGSDDHTSEVIWRDLDQRSLSQAADALGKLKNDLGIPAKGLWSRIPGATQSEVKRWEQLADEEDPTALLANAIDVANQAPPIPRLVPVDGELIE